MRLQPVITRRFAEGGSSGGSKLLWGLVIGCGAIGVLCCGAAGFVGWFGYATVASAVSENPQDVRQNTEQILSIDIPERFAPQASINVEPPFFGKVAALVVYQDPERDDVVLIGDVKGVEGQDPEQMFNNQNGDPNAQILSQHEESQADIQKGSDFEETSRETIERTVNGGNARFIVIEGKNTQSDRERVIVYGAFPGKIGGGMFAMNVNKQEGSVEEVKQVINSIE